MLLTGIFVTVPGLQVTTSTVLALVAILIVLIDYRLGHGTKVVAAPYDDWHTFFGIWRLICGFLKPQSGKPNSLNPEE